MNNSNSEKPTNSDNDVLLQFEVLNSLSGFIGSSAFGQYLAEYLHNTMHNIERLGHAIAAGDNERIKQMSHKLKGSAGNIGAMRLASICEKLQHIADEEDFGEGMCGHFFQLQAIFDETKLALDDYINQLAVSQVNVV